MVINLKLKQLLIALLSIYFSINYIYSQKIEWGSNFLSPHNKNNFIPKILGEDDENFYLYTWQGYTNEFTIEAIDIKNKNQKYIYKYDAEKSNNKNNTIWIKDVLLTNNRILVFIKEHDKSTSLTEIYVKIYNAKTGKIEDDHFEILAETTAKKYINSGNINVITSSNKTKILIRNSFFSEEKNKIFENFILFDDNLQKVISRENSYDESIKTTTSNFTLDENGNLYFIKQNDKGNFIASYDVEKDYEKWEEKIHFDKLNLAITSSVYNLKSLITNNNELIIFGIYSKTNMKNAFDGYIYFKVDKKSKEIIQEKLFLLEIPFIDEIAANGIGSPHPGNTGEVFTKPDLDVILLNSGEIILKSELYRNLYFRDFGRNFVNNNDLILSKINIDGVLSWSIRIPKRQYFKISDYNFKMAYYTHKLFTDSQNLYILFTDSPNNNFTTRVSPKLKNMINYKKAKISIYSISIENGNYETSSLTNNSENGIYFMPSICYQKNQNSNAYVFGKNDKRYGFGIFSK